MMQPQVRLEIDDPQRTFHPAELIAGQFSLQGVGQKDIRAVELSVLWHTEGKGDEDMSVLHFQRVEPKNGDSMDFRQPRRFSAVLPNSPLSYRGQILNICWSVRVRVFLMRGKELALEVPFQLGVGPATEGNSK